MEQDRLTYLHGELGQADSLAAPSRFAFPDPDGEQAVLAYHGCEVVTVPRHVSTREVEMVMTASTFDERTFASDDLAADERARSRFMVVVDADTGAETQRTNVSGSDIYRVGAMTAADVALRLVDSPSLRGVLAPSQALEAVSLFDLLAERGLIESVEMASPP
jgi:hypothetical protein